MEKFLPRVGYCVVELLNAKTTEVISESGFVLETAEAVKNTTTDRVKVVFTNNEYEVNDVLVIPDSAGKILSMNNTSYIILKDDEVLGKLIKD